MKKGSFPALLNNHSWKAARYYLTQPPLNVDWLQARRWEFIAVLEMVFPEEDKHALMEKVDCSPHGVDGRRNNRPDPSQSPFCRL